MDQQYISDKDAFEKAKAHLDDLIRQAPPELFENDNLAMHSQKVLDWARIIEPEAKFRLLIAAYTHDRDRADKGRVRKRPGELQDEYKKRHQERSANLIREFLVRIEARPELVQDVYQMILYHDAGELRTEDTELYKDYSILKDADAITFLQIGFPEYIRKWGVVATRDRSKASWDRLTDKAKRRPEVIELYEDFQRRLDEKERELFGEDNHENQPAPEPDDKNPGETN